MLTPRLSARFSAQAEAALSRLPRPGLIALGVVIVSWAGGHQIYHDYPLTLDEYVPTVQAAIFQAGVLAGTFPDPPVGSFENYFPLFFTYDEQSSLFIQYYRPLHAALLALTGLVGADDLLNPLAAGAAVLATARVARQIAPDRPVAPALAALLLALTPQFLAFAISDYAWPIHLAANMIWLALFLRGGAACLAAALVVGFLALGLHQSQVHAAFAFPVLAAFGLGWRRRLSWGRHVLLCALICGLYCFAIAFWLLWDNLALWLHTGEARFLPGSLGEVLALKPYAEDLRHRIDYLPTLYALLTASNILRLALWISPAAVFLLIFGAGRIRRPNADIAVLIAMILFSISVYMTLMPNQMLGWGYRYLTPLLGVISILAALALPAPGQRHRDGAVVSMLAWIGIGAAVFLPLRAAQVEATVRPAAQIVSRAEASEAAFVVNQVSELIMTMPLVRNAPDLSNRPLVLSDVHLPVSFFEDEADRIELQTLEYFRSASFFAVQRPFPYHPPGTSRWDHFVICPDPPPWLPLEQAADWRPQGPGFLRHCEARPDTATFRARRQDRDIRR